MILKRLTKLFIILSGFYFTYSPAVYAGADSGFYIGAGLGDATLTVKGNDPNSGDYNFNENDFGYKIFGGYNFGYVPLIDFAAEISYVDFGKPGSSLSNGDPLNFKVTGINAFGLAGVNFGPFGLFAKVGLINWNMDSTIGQSSSSDSGTDPAYGIGAKFQISSFAVRAEYEVYDVNPVNDLDMLTVSVVFTF